MPSTKTGASSSGSRGGTAGRMRSWGGEGSAGPLRRPRVVAASGRSGSISAAEQRFGSELRGISLSGSAGFEKPNRVQGFSAENEM